MEIEITRAVALISINATLFAQLVSFLIFMMLISRLMYQPLQDIVAERDRQIDLMKEDLETAEADLEQIYYDIELRTREVREEAFEIQHRLEKDGSKEADAVFAEIEARIGTLYAETKTEVQKQVDEVRKHLAEESERLSITIMEKALDRRLANE